MNNNIFVKKFNPDLENKFNTLKNSRNLKYINTRDIYNPITNVIPTKVNNYKDLLLDNTFYKSDLSLNNIINLRKTQDNNINYTNSNKIINNSNIIINNFEDLKKPYVNKKIENNNMKVLLKDLGLLNTND